MRKVYHLGTCSTCQRILKSLQLDGFILQDIKTEPVTGGQLDEMRSKAGSYEALFNRRAMKYRALGLHEKELKEEDYRDLILNEYTFLKRPVILIEDDLFVGNSKKTVAAVSERLKKP